MPIPCLMERNCLFTAPTTSTLSSYSYVFASSAPASQVPCLRHRLIMLLSPASDTCVLEKRRANLPKHHPTANASAFVYLTSCDRALPTTGHAAPCGARPCSCHSAASAAGTARPAECNARNLPMRAQRQRWPRSRPAHTRHRAYRTIDAAACIRCPLRSSRATVSRSAGRAGPAAASAAAPRSRSPSSCCPASARPRAAAATPPSRCPAPRSAAAGG